MKGKIVGLGENVPGKIVGLEEKVQRKVVGLEENEVKRKKENYVMSSFVILFHPKTQLWW